MDQFMVKTCTTVTLRMQAFKCKLIFLVHLISSKLGQVLYNILLKVHF